MTKRRALILAVIVVLALGVWLLWSLGNKGEAAAVLNLADRIASKDDATAKKEAEDVARKYKDLGPFMKLFKSRQGGGLGVGKKPGAIRPDGIEAKLKDLAKKEPSTAELEEQGDDLVRLCWVTAAIAEVTRHKCEVNKKVGFLDPQDWDRWSEGMHQASRELAGAVQARDAAPVKAAAVKLISNCNKCHRIFRE
jgi:hypothetical protein